MRLIEDLRADHQLIEQAVGSLRTFVEARLAGSGDPADGRRFLTFFRLYAGDFHHAKEEEVLLKALVEQAEIPGHRGPVAVIIDEHRRMGGLLDGMEPLLGAPLQEASQRARLLELAVDYSRSLWHHIDAENSVVFPEGQERLRRFNIGELPSRPPTPEESAAREAGIALLAAYPPLVDPGVMRGDGCVACPSYGNTCDGLEHEWWTEHDWEDARERMGSD
jgi:hemerythrin-like domain-containing protein